MNRIVVAVVTYNRKELLKECLVSLMNQSYAGFDIMVIDNASTDGTYEYIKDFLNGIIYINTKSNLGGAGGFNVAMKESLIRGYDYVWVMDDDTIPKNDSLNKIVQLASKLKNKWGFIASRVEWIDGSDCVMNIPKLIKTKRKSPKGTRFCRQASFVSLFIPTDIIRKVGLPIKDFFIWGDDVEYTRRISKLYPCYYLSNSEVIHKTGSNEGSNIAIDSQDRLERYRFAYRNEVFIAKKEGLVRAFYQISKILLHIARVLMSHKGEKARKIKIILKASFEGLKFNPQIEYIER